MTEIIMNQGIRIKGTILPRMRAFLDARYVFTDGTKNYGLGRASLRLAF